MEIEAVLVRALLAIHKELAELGGSERCSQHSLHEHKLIHAQYGDRALPRVRVREVCGV